MLEIKHIVFHQHKNSEYGEHKKCVKHKDSPSQEVWYFTGWYSDPIISLYGFIFSHRASNKLCLRRICSHPSNRYFKVSKIKACKQSIIHTWNTYTLTHFAYAHTNTHTHTHTHTHAHTPAQQQEMVLMPSQWLKKTKKNTICNEHQSSTPCGSEIPS